MHTVSFILSVLIGCLFFSHFCFLFFNSWGDGHIKVCTVNNQSIRNQTGDVVEHVLSNKIDICAVTETWLKPADDAIRQECQPVGYSFTDYPRQSGGTGLLCRSNLTPSLVRLGENKSFEFSEWLTKCPSLAIRLIVVYRPTYSKEHPISPAIFNEEWYYQKSPFWLQEILIFMLMTARTRMLQNSKIYCLNLDYNNMWMCQLTEMDTRSIFSSPGWAIIPHWTSQMQATTYLITHL